MRWSPSHRRKTRQRRRGTEGPATPGRAATTSASRSSRYARDLEGVTAALPLAPRPSAVAPASLPLEPPVPRAVPPGAVPSAAFVALPWPRARSLAWLGTVAPGTADEDPKPFSERIGEAVPPAPPG